MSGPAKQFDTEKVTSLAMGLFSRKGYEHTSINDLLAVMKIHRSSFYATFGSKRGLFLRALTEYRLLMLSRIRTALLEQSTDYVANIQNWLDQLMDAIHSGRATEMGTNAFLEIADRDPDVQQLANDFFLDLEEIVYTALKLSGSSIQFGQLNRQHLASMIALHIQSILLLYKSGVPISMIENSVALTKAILGTLKPLKKA